MNALTSTWSLLAGAALCCGLAACQSGGSKDRMVARLEIHAPFEAVACQVEAGKCSVQEVGLNGRILAQSERRLTPAEEAAFWTSLDHLQVREWRRNYGVTVGEGTQPPTSWKFATKRGRSATISQGVGAFPGDEQPREVSPETSTRFHSLYSLFQSTVNPPTAQVAERVAP